jgi:hypothetical protein
MRDTRHVIRNARAGAIGSDGMSDDAIEILEQELGARIPEGLEALADDELLLLADLLAEAKASQAQELEEGVQGSLEIVPRLMRGPVRKILFG